MIDRVYVEPAEVRRLVRALNAESDGKELKRDLTRKLRVAAEPALVQAKGAIIGMGSMGLGKAPSLRLKIADGVKAHVRLSGRPGLTIAAHMRGMPRKFRKAPKLTNSSRGWRHMVFGNREVWVRQFGEPQWFHDSMRAHRREVIVAAADALDEVANRIGRKTKG